MHPVQPYQTNVSVALIDENGDTNHEQQKGPQIILHSLMKLLLLLICRVLQLVAPTKVSLTTSATKEYSHFHPIMRLSPPQPRQKIHLIE